jgi:hypothetical protein
MNQKSLIAVLGVVVIILIGTTVYFATINKAIFPVAPAPKVVQQQSATTPTPAEQPTQPSPVIQGIVYSNTQYGFQLTFSDNWKGYTATNLSKEALDGCVANINFNIPKWDGVFGIKICTKVQWAKLQKDAEYMANTQNLILGENNTYVYIFGQGTMLAGGSDGVTNDAELAAQLKAVESIRKTFKITQ